MENSLKVKSGIILNTKEQSGAIAQEAYRVLEKVGSLLAKADNLDLLKDVLLKYSPPFTIKAIRDETREVLKGDTTDQRVNLGLYLIIPPISKKVGNGQSKMVRILSELAIVGYGLEFLADLINLNNPGSEKNYSSRIKNFLPIKRY